jgi:hypothetical protein
LKNYLVGSEDREVLFRSFVLVEFEGRELAEGGLGGGGELCLVAIDLAGEQMRWVMFGRVESVVGEFFDSGVDPLNVWLIFRY